MLDILIYTGTPGEQEAVTWVQPTLYYLSPSTHRACHYYHTMAEKPQEQVEMAPDPEEDDLDDLDGERRRLSRAEANL